MVDQWMRRNSSDGSNGKMTGWFWKRGVGCLRGLGLDGGVFLFCGFLGGVGKENRWRLMGGGEEVSRKGWTKFLVGWGNGMMTGKYMKMGWKRCFCVEAFV